MWFWYMCVAEGASSITSASQGHMRPQEPWRHWLHAQLVNVVTLFLCPFLHLCSSASLIPQYHPAFRLRPHLCSSRRESVMADLDCRHDLHLGSTETPEVGHTCCFLDWINLGSNSPLNLSHRVAAHIEDHGERKPWLSVLLSLSIQQLMSTQH